MNLKAKNQTELYGFKNVFRELCLLYNKDKLPSKILLSGQKGIGKCTFAYHLINYALSQDEENSYDIKRFIINENNKSFKLILNETNPNFSLVDVRPDKKLIDIDQIRNLINLMNKSSFNKKPRFILIDNIEFLNVSSVNALLKILEEPNENIYFILIHNNSKILETLKSRCLSFKLFLRNKEALEITEKLLKANISDKINLNLINYYSTPGNIYRLVDFFEKLEIQLKDLELKEFLELIIKQKTYKKDINIRNMIYEFIEFFLIKKNMFTKTDYFNYFINQMNNVKKFNLDEDSFFIEFRSKILNG